MSIKSWAKNAKSRLVSSWQKIVLEFQSIDWKERQGFLPVVAGGLVFFVLLITSASWLSEMTVQSTKWLKGLPWVSILWYLGALVLIVLVGFSIWKWATTKDAPDYKTSKKWGQWLAKALVLVGVLWFVYRDLNARADRRAEVTASATREETRMVEKYALRWNTTRTQVIVAPDTGTGFITPPPNTDVKWDRANNVAYRVLWKNAQGDTGSVIFPKDSTEHKTVPPFRSIKFFSLEKELAEIICECR